MIGLALRIRLIVHQRHFDFAKMRAEHFQSTQLTESDHEAIAISRGLCAWPPRSTLAS
jgi:hypothetical protein